MARLPYLDPSDLAPADRDLLERPINLHRILVHSPKGARAFLGLSKFIRHESRLDPRLREMAILQIGYLARSPYEYSHHVKIGREFGVTDNDIRAITAATQGRPVDMPAIDQAVLAAAREMAVDSRLADPTFATLVNHLGPEQVTDLVMIISFYCGVVRFLGALEIDVEDTYQQYLDEFPLTESGSGL